MAVRDDVSTLADVKSYLRQRFGHMDAFTSWLTTLPSTRLPRLRRLIYISSIGALSPGPNLVVYSATKAAVDAITKGLAAELGPKKILVNSVLPGATDIEGLPKSNSACIDPTDA